jgi:lysophospholipase
MTNNAPLLIDTADNPTPGNHVVGWFESVGGKRLRYAIFKSDMSVARGTVVLLQGRNECIEKYYETIRHFTARGLWVATFDWRGQGLSDRLLKNPLRGHLRQFQDFEADLSIFLETIVLPETRLPFCMVAHSMGALVALSMAPELSNRIERMVLLAPFIELSNQKTAELGHSGADRSFQNARSGLARVRQGPVSASIRRQCANHRQGAF